MRIGCHIDVNGSLENVFQIALDIGANAVQVFLSAPINKYAGKPIKNADAIKKMIEKLNIYIVVHGKYIINFCQQNDWNINALVGELRSANSIGNDIGVVLHQGKNVKKLPKDEAISLFVQQVEETLKQTDDIKNPIYLENSCGQGTEIGYTLDELITIWKGFTDKSKERLGFCIDTCHIYTAGELQFKSEEEVDAFFTKFDDNIGLEYLKVIHLNDSMLEFGKRVDRHAPIMSGYITNSDKGGNIDGMKRTVYWAKKHDIPLILETSSDTERQMKLLNEWEKEMK